MDGHAPAPADAHAPGRLSYHPLVRAVVDGLRRRCPPEASPPEASSAPVTLVVATSGGADSVALLRALHLLGRRRTWRMSLVVAHINHHLRPEDEARGDAAFVAALAAELGLPYEHADIAPASEAGNVEAAARRLRYAALARIAERRGAAHVVTAHHADDQLETLLMALLRGTTPKGLRGIAWRRRLVPGVTLLRPMLGATHEEALSFLRQLGQPWREDATNADRSRTRARLRHDVLPVLRSLRPDAAKKAVRLSDALRDSERKNRRAEERENADGSPKGV